MGSSSHAALPPAQARAKLKGLDHLDAVVSTKPKWTFCSLRQHPSDRIPLRYQVAADDTRMLGSDNTSRGFVGALVLPTTTDAKTCYRWLRAVWVYSNDRFVKQKPGKPFGHCTLITHQHKLGAPGSEAGTTGNYDCVILNGHTVVYGESHNAKDATMIESDADTLRDLIGN
jgi:hypothetical protein